MATPHFYDLIHSKQSNKLSFTIRDIPVALLNSIRRVILSEIPNVAFKFELPPYDNDQETIIIKENKSSLHNEYLKQRLSLIPINLSPNDILNFDHDNYKFVLTYKNNDNKTNNVTTEHITIYDSQNKILPNEFIRSVFPKYKITSNIYDFILIHKLKHNPINKEDGDSIHIEMKASKNIAKSHPGFSFVSQCSYINVIDQVSARKELKQRIQYYKNTIPNISDQELLRIEPDFNNLDKQKFYVKNKFGEPSLFYFTIESEYYKISPQYLFFKAFLILYNKVYKLIQNILQDNIPIKPKNNIPNTYDIYVHGEMHTLGNLLQSLIYDKFILNDNSKDIKFVGYKCPHPLDNFFILTIQFSYDISIDEAQTIFIKDALEYILTLLTNFNKQWIKVSGLSPKYSQDIFDFLEEFK
jgi:DNA-directed RNA polymerase subunit L